MENEEISGDIASEPNSSSASSLRSNKFFSATKIDSERISKARIKSNQGRTKNRSNSVMTSSVSGKSLGVIGKGETWDFQTEDL